MDESAKQQQPNQQSRQTRSTHGYVLPMPLPESHAGKNKNVHDPKLEQPTPGTQGFVVLFVFR